MRTGDRRRPDTLRRRAVALCLAVSGCVPGAFIEGPRVVLAPLRSDPCFPGAYSGYDGRGSRCQQADPVGYPRGLNAALMPYNVLSIATLTVLPLAMVSSADAEGDDSFLHLDFFSLCMPVHGGWPCAAVMVDLGCSGDPATRPR